MYDLWAYDFSKSKHGNRLATSLSHDNAITLMTEHASLTDIDYLYKIRKLPSGIRRTIQYQYYNHNLELIDYNSFKTLFYILSP